ncbi:hypothetical protein LCGC14_0275520 [marine sediment metagenome]|uniref:AP2/ERF domain-containing protein n=1 Tax=marine sediment metagenome TaxID=412755 RepID=A0A0F9UEF1_9ZZZZ
MKEIPLTQGFVSLVDDEDYEWLSLWKWYAAVSVQAGGPRAVRVAPKADGGSGHRIIYMHRVILDAQPGEDVDHANHDTLDNQRKNIRRCTRSQNLMNSRKRLGCSSRYKGVYWHKRDRRWLAQIQKEGKRYHLGCFSNERDAACAYDLAAVEYFGEFASPNNA